MENVLWYGAFKTLDKKRKAFYEGYLKFASLKNIKEIITLDSLLCPEAFKIDDEGWNYAINEDFMGGFYLNLDYVKKRISGLKDINLIAVIRDPTHHMTVSGKLSNAFFAGYDLMDIHMDISILTNTGCNQKVIPPRLKNKYGLIDQFEVINKIEKDNERVHKDKPHSEGYIFEIWKYYQT